MRLRHTKLHLCTFSRCLLSLLEIVTGTIVAYLIRLSSAASLDPLNPSLVIKSQREIIRMNRVRETLTVGTYSLTVSKRLAEGGFGFVDLVIENGSKQEYVLKRCGVQRPEMMAIVKKEVDMLRKFQGRYVVKMFASQVITLSNGMKEACLLLEYCPGGNLFERLDVRSRNQQERLPLQNVCKIFGELLLALKPMHEHCDNNGILCPITHRDLKLENILFATDGKDVRLRLCDFGSCAIGHISVRTSEEQQAYRDDLERATTPIYRAPEMRSLSPRSGYLTEKTDIWALGCIFYQLCFIQHPFAVSSEILRIPKHDRTPGDYQKE